MPRPSTLLAVISCGIAASCGGQPASRGPQDPVKLTLTLPDAVVVHAGETLIVTLIAIGGAGPVTFEVSGLPPYATATGNTIRAAPSRMDTAGDSTVTVTATDRATTDHGSFVLSLANASPVFSTAAISTTVPGPSTWFWTPAVTLDSTDAPVVLQAKARVQVVASDADLDPVRLLVKLDDGAGGVTSLASPASAPGQSLIVDFPALQPGTHYALDAWLEDSHGAQSSHLHRSDLSRSNSAPTLCDSSFLTGNDGGIAYVPIGSTPAVQGPARLVASYCDVDGDTVEILAELRPAGEPLTGTPTHTLSGAPWIAHFQTLELALPEVAVGAHYQLSWWFRDSYGAESTKALQSDFVRAQ